MPRIDDVSKLKSGSVEEKLAVLDRLDGGSDSADLQLLFESLSDAKWVVRKRASDRLGAAGAAVLSELERMLAGGNEEQKFWVMKALVAVGAPSVPVFVRALTGGDELSRVYSASALGELADPVAIPHLVAALGDPVWRVRRNAFGALGTFGEAALGELEKGMQSANEDSVFWSAKALGKIGGKARNVLLDSLKKGSNQLRFIVAAALGESGDTRIIQVLINNLKASSWIVQKRSCEALAEIGSACLEPIAEALLKATPPQDYWLMLALSKMGSQGLATLENVLVSNDESFRWDKKEALGRIGEVLVPLFERIYDQPEKDIRLFAVTCLGDLPLSRSADNLLLNALSDPSWSIRKVAADCLAARGPAMLDRLSLALETGSEDLRFWVTYIFRKMGDIGISYLIKALGDSNKNIAYFASSALGEVRNRDVVRPLIKALKDSSWPVRKNASESLAQLAEFAVPQLINFVNDEDEDIQYWVLKTLKRIGSPAVPDIVWLLKKGTDEQRFFAAKALGMMKEPSSADALIEALQDGHEWVRLYAAIALGELGETRAISHLVNCLLDPSFKVHTSIFKVFEKFGAAALPPLIELMKSENPTAVKNALRVVGRLQDESTFDDMKGFLTHPSDEIKLAAVDAVANFRDKPDVVAMLAVMLANSSDKVRRRIFLALGEMGTEEGLAQLLKATLLVENEGEKKVLVDLIVRQGDKAVPVLAGLLGSERVPLRRAAAEMLSRLGEKAREAVEAAMGSEDKNVRFWAAKVIKAINDKGVVA